MRQELAELRLEHRAVELVREDLAEDAQLLDGLVGPAAVVETVVRRESTHPAARDRERDREVRAGGEADGMIALFASRSREVVRNPIEADDVSGAKLRCVPGHRRVLSEHRWVAVGSGADPAVRDEEVRALVAELDQADAIGAEVAENPFERRIDLGADA